MTDKPLWPFYLLAYVAIIAGIFAFQPVANTLTVCLP